MRLNRCQQGKLSLSISYEAVWSEQMLPTYFKIVRFQKETFALKPFALTATKSKRFLPM